MALSINFSELQQHIDGDLFADQMHLIMYSTDASVYRERPLAVVYPKNSGDVQKVIAFAHKNQCSIIPRAAGTSLAGQVVGNGIILDCSRYMNKIIEVNQEENYVIIEPGVVLDELNHHIEDYGLFFGPETSTSTHCTLGGMFGNNSCGTHSIVYGSVRQHILEAEVVLANGDLVTFKAQTKEELDSMTGQSSEQDRITKALYDLVKPQETLQLIDEKYPPANVIRRNTGYALDYLANTACFKTSDRQWNICELLAGSEGTLGFTTKMKLHVDPLPPQCKAVVALQHETLAQSCQANLIALSHDPTAVELMDDIILKMARQNPVQRKASAFIQGTPKAILLVEFMEEDAAILDQRINQFLDEVKGQKLIHHYTVLYNDEVKLVWNLRKAGLGVLGNMVGDKKPVALVEDTAVAPEVLEDYVADFEALMNKYDNECVFYAHISAGELHLRPILNLKDHHDRELFRKIGQESAALVAKYHGSISGEHGDGRLRGEFIPIQYGQEVYELFLKVKDIFDPQNIFNPQKIVETAPMDEFLRYEDNQETKAFDTKFDFSKDQGLLRAAEKCNGVGYCRKSPIIGGTMCPSFQATRHEKDSTRARANTLRDVLTNSTSENPFASDEIYEALDLCLSCKGCKTECPSSVDMAKLKAETLYQRYKTKGAPMRSKQIATMPVMMQKVQSMAPIVNFVSNLSPFKKVMGFAPKRSLPKVQRQTLQQWAKNKTFGTANKQKLYFFNDEFTNLYDTEIGQQAIQLLEALGYQVALINDLISGRTYLSKGFLDEAQSIAQKNVAQLEPVISENEPLLGIEPSAILTFRDEYIDLLRGDAKEQAKRLAKNTFMVEEFLANEFAQGKINPEQFSDKELVVKLHGHCQQKSMIGNQALVDCLSIMPNVTVEVIPSGCCGMAGSFGYEAEHYDLSMSIGELVLFPAVRNSPQEVQILAPGTSCRHQIADGTQRKALHPVQLLWEMVRK